MTARRPLAALAADLARLDAEELPFLTQIDVRADASAITALGFPERPNTASAWQGRDVLWLGPDEWLVVAEAGSEAVVLEGLEAALGSVHRSVINVSANRAVFELRGPDHLVGEVRAVERAERGRVRVRVHGAGAYPTAYTGESSSATT